MVITYRFYRIGDEAHWYVPSVIKPKDHVFIGCDLDTPIRPLLRNRFDAPLADVPNLCAKCRKMLEKA
jgi:hypothetical protein